MAHAFFRRMIGILLSNAILICVLSFGCVPAVFAASPVLGEIINVNARYKIAFTDLSNYYLSVGDILEVQKDGKFITYLKVSETSSVISKLVPIVEPGKYQTKIDFNKLSVGSNVIKIDSPEGSLPQTPAEPVSPGVPQPIAVVQPTPIPVVTPPVPVITKSNAPVAATKDIELYDSYVKLSQNFTNLLEEKKQLQESCAVKQQQVPLLQSQNDQLRNRILELQGNISQGQTACQQQQAENKKLHDVIEQLKKKLETLSKLLEGK